MRSRLLKAAVVFAACLAISGWLASAGIARTGIQTKAAPARPAERPESPQLSDSGKAALSRQLSEAVSRGDAPGVVGLVVGRDGVLYESAAGKLGVADDVAMPVNAIFSIASMTKPVTSVAIMMLLDEASSSSTIPSPNIFPASTICRSSRSSTRTTPLTKRAQQYGR
jgi:CubicO group peptidase (beta-lactamase class C family)